MFSLKKSDVSLEIDHRFPKTKNIKCKNVKRHIVQSYLRITHSSLRIGILSAYVHCVEVNFYLINSSFIVSLHVTT